MWPTLGEWIAPIAAFCFIGAFIDFYIGKSGQQAVKKKLEDWWLKSSYLKWSEFGRDEAFFASRLIYFMFGTTFSMKRMKILFTIFLFVSALTVYLPLLFATGIVFELRYRSIYQDNIDILLVLAVFSLSITLTAIAARSMAHVIGKRPHLNLIALLGLISFQYLLFCYSQALFLFFRNVIPVFYLYATSPNKVADYPAFRELLTLTIESISNWFSIGQMDPRLVSERIKIALSFSLFDVAKTNGFVFALLMSVVVNVGRVLILFVFLASHLLQPLRAPVMTIWARIVESEKPTFTLVFGGVAALLKAAQELLKAFSS